MNRRDKKIDAIEYDEPIDVLEEVAPGARGRWVYHILKVAIGILLYKVLFAAAPHLKSLLSKLS